MKNIYTLGNTCHPNVYCQKYLPEYTAKTVFAGIIHNQLLSPFCIVPQYIFDFKRCQDIFDEKNWIVCKNLAEDSQRIHIYVDKEQKERKLGRFYFQCDNSLKRLLLMDLSSEIFNFDLHRTNSNSTNTSFYNVKYNFIYPHGDARTSLQSYLEDMRQRYEEFKRISHYCVFIYRFDVFVRYQQLLRFEEFLLRRNYDLDNFIFIDTDNHGFIPTRIRTYQYFNNNTSQFFIDNKDMLVQKSKELERKYLEENKRI